MRGLAGSVRNTINARRPDQLFPAIQRFVQGPRQQRSDSEQGLGQRECATRLPRIPTSGAPFRARSTLRVSLTHHSHRQKNPGCAQIHLWCGLPRESPGNPAWWRMVRNSRPYNGFRGNPERTQRSPYSGPVSRRNSVANSCVFRVHVPCSYSRKADAVGTTKIRLAHAKRSCLREGSAAATRSSGHVTKQRRRAFGARW